MEDSGENTNSVNPQNMASAIYLKFIIKFENGCTKHEEAIGISNGKTTVRETLHQHFETVDTVDITRVHAGLPRGTYIHLIYVVTINWDDSFRAIVCIYMVLWLLCPSCTCHCISKMLKMCTASIRGFHPLCPFSSAGSVQSWNVMEKCLTWKKFVMESHGNVMEFENFQNVMEMSWNFIPKPKKVMEMSWNFIMWNRFSCIFAQHFGTCKRGVVVTPCYRAKSYLMMSGNIILCHGKVMEMSWNFVDRILYGPWSVPWHYYLFTDWWESTREHIKQGEGEYPWVPQLNTPMQPPIKCLN